jgi:ribonuclease P protein component
MQQFTFRKEERLCSKIILDKLFSEGKSLFSFPFKLVYLPIECSGTAPVQVVFSVPKRTFKHAVSRNLLRRRMREAYRLNKSVLYEKLIPDNRCYALVIIYVDKTVQEYQVIEKGMKKLLVKLTSTVA